jgi:5-dehydro-4-deoxyglucarate dehydratase
MNLEGVLFFPVTPFDSTGLVEQNVLAEHIHSGIEHDAGAVFAACGTGEFHALSANEVAQVVDVAVRTTNRRVPVFSGAGGAFGQAIESAKRASGSGVDGLLLLPPYLVTGPGLRDYVLRVADASDVPIVIYHRGTARFTAETVAELAGHERIIGFKDGIGDIGLAQEIVSTVRAAGHNDFLFFNGLLTAELSQGAYRGIGMPLYSSAAFAMAPEIASAYYEAYKSGDEERRLLILNRFYVPLVNLRDQTPGFGVSLIKAGLRLQGVPVGSVRPPLVDPSQPQLTELQRILDIGRALL